MLLAVSIVAQPRSWPVVLVPLAAFLVDTSFTLVTRMLRGEQWWTPHVQHAYQKWARAHGSHVAVTVAYASFSVVGMLVMVGHVVLGQPMLAWMGLGWCALAACLWTRQEWMMRVGRET